MYCENCVSEEAECLSANMHVVIPCQFFIIIFLLFFYFKIMKTCSLDIFVYLVNFCDL